MLGESNQNQEVGGGCGVQSEEGKLSVHAVGFECAELMDKSLLACFALGVSVAAEDGGDAEVGGSVIVSEEVVGDWFVGVFAVEVVSVSSEAGVEGVLCFSDVVEVAAGT